LWIVGWADPQKRNPEIGPGAKVESARGVVVLRRAQLSMVLEGIDWRMP
jgi:hypothetical protein